MKKIKYGIILIIFVSFLPINKTNANLEIGADAKAEVRIDSPRENTINLRRLDLNKRLFKEEVKEKVDAFQKARDAFKNSSSDNRNIMRSEFRAKFVERFKFTLDKLSEFQTKMSARIKSEENAGVDVSKSEVKLEESISFMAEIESDISKLKSLMDEKYSEDERSAKKEEAKVLVERIKTNLKSSHMALKESLRELHAAKVEVKVETSTDIEANLN
ncbi:MAG: hypothetical protein R3B55_00940 [Candidatus Paceibacterota bacterium]